MWRSRKGTVAFLSQQKVKAHKKDEQLNKHPTYFVSQLAANNNSHGCCITEWQRYVPSLIKMKSGKEGTLCMS